MQRRSSNGSTPRSASSPDRLVVNVGAFLTKAARVHPARAALTDGSAELRYDELDRKCWSLSIFGPSRFE